MRKTHETSPRNISTLNIPPQCIIHEALICSANTHSAAAMCSIVAQVAFTTVVGERNPPIVKPQRLVGGQSTSLP